MRGIPPVRLWKVTALDSKLRPVESVFIHAVNRRFAKWNARDAYPELFWNAYSVRAYAVPRVNHV